MTETVHVAVYEGLSDWEIGHTLANLRGGVGQASPGRFEVRTVGPTTDPVVTMGGLRVVPDMVLAELRPADSAMLVLGGSTGWLAGDAVTEPFARTARAFLDAGVPVAAICGAVAGLAREGLLDDRAHTGAAAEFLASTGYAGGALYREADAVTDRDLITAGPTEPVPFAREIFARLGVYSPAKLDAWFRLHAHGDASAYYELMAA
ncbi:DJ-1/PfpI family protein [Kutzneria kofuensis]|uniref:Putative intracellular protease/amidase n=1 Tax=Kutzneria kofuensis TaxID=103725 RepID=A0A7W9NMS4_9PSEU|nr:DJ-1/PfpI family protein [Kutzneria kofuensis]MBB5897668.1 putative intracellular protease/amidase [Kutzneria kofuensis]